jgi:hypothetical protein
VPDGPTGGATDTTFTAPSGPTANALQQALRAVTPPRQQQITPSRTVLPGPVTAAQVVGDPTDRAQRQSAAISGAATLDAPPAVPALAPKPGNFAINLLSAVGLRPDAFPPGSPLAPIGRVLEFVYAGLRRFDRTFSTRRPRRRHW